MTMNTFETLMFCPKFELSVNSTFCKLHVIIKFSISMIFLYFVIIILCISQVLRSSTHVKQNTITHCHHTKDI